jgi:hypothetical protein
MVMSKHNRQTCGKGVAALFRREARASCALIVLVCLCTSLVFHAGAQSNKDRAGSTSKNRRIATTKTSGVKPKVYKTVDPCAIASPNASLSLGPGVLGVQATSDGGNYHGEGGCGLYIVDITVPSDSSAPSFLPSFNIESGPVDLKLSNGKDMSSGTNYAGGFALPDKVCSGYHQETRIFVKESDADKFTLIRSASVKGTSGYNVGKPEKCVLVPETGKGVLSLGLPFGFHPSQSGAKVYRVAVGAHLAIQSGIWQKVHVKASHDADIK